MNILWSQTIYKEKKLQTHVEYEMLNNINIQIVSIINKFN